MGRAKERNAKRREGMVEQATLDAQSVCGGAKRNGKPCLRAAGWGTDHRGSGRCKHHGGSTLSHRVAAANNEGARIATPIPTTPGTSIQAVMDTFRGHLAFFTSKLADEDALIVDTAFGPQLSPWYLAQRRAAKDLIDAATRAAGAGIAERQVALAEREAEMIEVYFSAVLAELKLSTAQRQKLGPAMRKHIGSLQPAIEGSAVEQ